MSTQILDPFDAATHAGETADMYFGKLEISAQFVSLVKGQRKTTWTEGMDPSNRNTELMIRLNPLDCTGLSKMVERSVLAESREWSSIVWSSLKDLGVKNARDINGKWAQVEMIKSGRTYVNRDGETVANTTFKFICLHNTEADCINAYRGVGSSKEAHTPAVAVVEAPVATPVDDKAYKDALAFLPMVITMAAGDRALLASTLKSFPQTSAYFTVDSPEVQALLKAA